jgi:hypothetical protein
VCGVGLECGVGVWWSVELEPVIVVDVIEMECDCDGV